jgi:RNA polymerase sigma factor (sigma-70 family)
MGGEPIRTSGRVTKVTEVSEGLTAEIPIVAGVADFATFYRLNYDPVARALGVTLRDWELAGEAADEGMARGYLHWGTVQTYDNPAGWVYRVGLNWARSVQRRLARRYPYAERLAVEPPPITDPLIDRALGELEVHLRAVVVCRYFLDWSTSTTADALGIRPGTVKSRLSRALNKLEAKLESMR